MRSGSVRSPNPETQTEPGLFSGPGAPPLNTDSSVAQQGSRRPTALWGYSESPPGPDRRGRYLASESEGQESEMFGEP